eukprot:6532814-Ditylum_brightwellii.AAC.1
MPAKQMHSLRATFHFPQQQHNCKHKKHATTMLRQTLSLYPMAATAAAAYSSSSAVATMVVIIAVITHLGQRANIVECN